MAANRRSTIRRTSPARSQPRCPVAHCWRCSRWEGLIGAVLYGAIIVLYLGVRKRLGRQEDAFDLGRFDMPVAIAALLWSVVVVVVLVSPADALTAVLISLGVLVAGGVYLAYLLIFNREIMETEPGDVDVFKH